jgi:spore germination protein YaaH
MRPPPPRRPRRLRRALAALAFAPVAAAAAGGRAAAQAAPPAAPPAVPAPAAAPARAPSRVGERLFYYVDAAASWESFRAHADRIDVVAPQSYVVDSLGIVFGRVDPALLALARARGVRVMPLLVNEGFQQPALRRLLGDTAAQARAVASMVALARRDGYWGWQFDVEGVPLADRDRFTAFYARAAAALRRAGFAISVAVVPRSSDDEVATGYGRFLHDSWRGAYDLAALARIGDFVSLMTYDQHTRRTAPGPVAGLPWVREQLAFALRSVPPERLSLGVPLYGRHWFTGEAPPPDRAAVRHQAVTWAWGRHLAERSGGVLAYDAAEGTTWGHFAVGGQWEWVFLEDVRAFGAKAALVGRHRLRGVSAWVLGQEDARIWDGV